MENLQSIIFNNKEKFSDGVYKEMMDELKKIHDEKEKKQYYRAVMSVMSIHQCNGDLQIQYGRREYIVTLIEPYQNFDSFRFGNSGWTVCRGVLRQDNCPNRVFQYDDPETDHAVHCWTPEMILVSLKPISD